MTENSETIGGPNWQAGLLRRLRAESEGPSPTADRSVMAPALGCLFVAGAVLGVISLVLPRDPGINSSGIFVVALLAGNAGAVCFLARDRLPVWAFPAFLIAATLMVDASIYLSNRGTASYAFYFFVWVVLFACYFLSRAQAFLQIAWIAVTYLAVLAIGPSNGELAQRWMMTVGTLMVLGTFVSFLRHRVENLITRLSDAAQTDPLTGLMNRRGFHELFGIELERARRSRRPLSLLVADLDHFKRVNDRLGHPGGDRVLKRFSQTLKREKRRIDSAARLGGEEFALILPDTDDHGAYIIADRLRRAIREAFADQRMDLTISFGVATYPRHGDSEEVLLSAADQALYVAKELGRDRVALYMPEVTTGLLATTAHKNGHGESFLSAILVLAQMLDIRDTGTAAHSETVGRYSSLIAAELGLPAERVERVRLAGVLHDVGKVGVPDSILQKPGPLSDAEWEEMRKHPELGSRLLQGAELDDLSSWVLWHHERPDGIGYPQGLVDDEIPLEAKILSVADAYEAMTADRVYRASIGEEAAREELRRCSGTQFDAEVVEAFLAALAAAESRRAPIYAALPLDMRAEDVAS